MEITITIKITEEQIPENTLMQIYSEKFNNWIKAEEYTTRILTTKSKNYECNSMESKSH